MKLHALHCKNFRIFKDHRFEFKPLTILVGPNSSGKSTVVKALMLLQENLKLNKLGRLVFDTGAHRLGSFETIINRDVKNKNICFNVILENDTYTDRKHLLSDVKFISFFYEYERPSGDSENGILVQYKMSVGKGKGVASLIEVKKKGAIFTWHINTSWFVDRILEKELFKFKPLLYKIWDYLSLQDIDEELKRQKEALEQAREDELRDLRSGRRDDDDIKNLLEQIKTVEKEIELSEIDWLSFEKEFADETKKIEDFYSRKIEHFQKAIDEIEERERRVEQTKGLGAKELIDWAMRRKPLQGRKEQLESERDAKLKELYKYLTEKYEVPNVFKIQELSELREELDALFNKKSSKIYDDYQAKLNDVRESGIRGHLYSQLKETAKHILEQLGRYDIGGRESIPTRDEETIADFLDGHYWREFVYKVVGKNSSEKIVNLVPWSEETYFVKNILIEKGDLLDPNKGGKEEVKSGRSLTFNDIVGDGEGNQLSQSFIEAVEELIKISREPLPFYYLTALRGYQQRVYKISLPQPTHLEESLSALLHFQVESRQDALSFVQKWVREFGIASDSESLQVEPIEGGHVQAYLQDENTGHKVNIANLGLGAVQLLPLIIFTAKALGTNQLLCIEEPGIHLHPDMQSKLVDFIQDAISNNVLFLLETHSEYFIRKLQYQVAKEKSSSFEPDLIQIRYLNPLQGEDLLIFINKEGELIDEDGQVLSGFGNGFLDEAVKWNYFREAKVEMKRGNEVVVCEGKNAEIFNELNISKYVFFGSNPGVSFDSRLVFSFVGEGFRGIRDRDFLTDEEIEILVEAFPKYHILDYYAYENYLCHPDNVLEACELNGIEFDRTKYVDDIRRLKEESDIITSVIPSLEQVRFHYEEIKWIRDKYFMQKYRGERNKSDKSRFFKRQIEFIVSSLIGDSFEDFYKFFSMKPHFKENVLLKYRLTEENLYSTKWFRGQVLKILRIDS